MVAERPNGAYDVDGGEHMCHVNIAGSAAFRSSITAIAFGTLQCGHLAEIGLSAPRLTPLCTFSLSSFAH